VAKVPNVAANEELTKFFQERRLSVDDFTARLKNGGDSVVLEIYTSAIKNQRVS